MGKQTRDDTSQTKGASRIKMHVVGQRTCLPGGLPKKWKGWRITHHAETIKELGNWDNIHTCKEEDHHHGITTGLYLLDCFKGSLWGRF